MNEEKVIEQLLEKIVRYYFSQASDSFLDYRSPDELRAILDLNRPEKPGDWREILGWVDKYLEYSVKTNHPMFVNRMWVGANLPSIVGEIVAAVTNTSACTYESAPVSTLMERHMIGRMLEIAGFTGGEGQMTTGSSNANMIAMMTARNLADPSIKKGGLFGRRKLFALVGADAHYSLDRAANILGLGAEQLVKVELDASGAMLPAALEKALGGIVAAGGRPFFVVATAGTTVRGGFDSIPALLALRQKYGFWLHVDGAWGGVAVFSRRLREEYLQGLEEADSFTFDFHKMLGTSLMCNVLLINKRSDALARVLPAGDGSYLFRNESVDGDEDLGPSSLQCGRRVDSLKWFLDWKFFGQEGFAARVEKNLALCEYAEQVVRASDELELVTPRPSFNVCFRFKVAQAESNDFNLALRTALHREGISLVGVGYIDGVLAMRLLVNNPLAEKSDVDAFFATLIARGRQLLQETPLPAVAGGYCPVGS